MFIYREHPGSKLQYILNTKRCRSWGGSRVDAGERRKSYSILFALLAVVKAVKHYWYGIYTVSNLGSLQIMLLYAGCADNTCSSGTLARDTLFFFNYQLEHQAGKLHKTQMN